MRKLAPFALAAALLALTPAVASASTMPIADFGRAPELGVGLGYGVGLSIDLPIGEAFSIGGAAYLQNFANAGGNVRALLKLTDVEKLRIDLLGGAGVLNTGSSNFNLYPFLGVALDYPFTQRLTGRLNVAVDFSQFYALDASGIELGYKFTNRLEGTLGGNGHNEFLGLRFKL